MTASGITLGIDPGLATVGYGVVQAQEGTIVLKDFGVIETPAGMPMSERLLLLHTDLKALLEHVQPDRVVFEDLFFSSNAKTALDVAQARGVLLMTVESKGIPILSLTPNQVKVGITGDGRADKRQVQEMLKREFDLPELPRPDDAADAVAIAYVGAVSFSSS